MMIILRLCIRMTIYDISFVPSVVYYLYIELDSIVKHIH
jgi:hypothetical protein